MIIGEKPKILLDLPMTFASELQQYQNKANPAAALKQARKNTGPRGNGKGNPLRHSRAVKVYLSS